MSAVAGYFPNLPPTTMPLGAGARVPIRTVVDASSGLTTSKMPPRMSRIGSYARRIHEPHEIGQRLGVWTVTIVYPSSAATGKGPTVRIRCVCGAEKFTTSHTLRLLHSKRHTEECSHVSAAARQAAAGRLDGYLAHE